MSKFSIVIPAYNEEKAIESIIKRCVSIRKRIIKEVPEIESVEILVVNDGSSDTTEIVIRKFSEIKTINHKINKGYGAALKTGFKLAKGQILGFLDADGTCDPESFIPLIRLLLKNNADIVIGSRLNAASEMPKIRRFGNRIFAKVVNLLGREKITDSASGMRVLRRSILPRIYPLPDGLNFTPAMSIRATLDNKIRIFELPIPYKVRRGKSKLSVVKDGFRFLRIILEIALSYIPLKFFGSIGLFFLVVAFLYGLYPLYYYLHYRQIEEYMIYRFITILVLSTSGINFISLGVLSDYVVSIVHDKPMIYRSKISRLTEKVFFSKMIWFAAALIAGAVILNCKTFFQYISTGHISVHWIYVLTGAIMLLLGLQIFAFSILKKVLLMLKQKNEFARRYYDIEKR